MKTPSQEIDDIIKNTKDWQAKKLSQLRAIITKTDPEAIEEVKWKKPSKPEGVPVWSHNGILCIAETLKNAVRLTFPKGAQIADPKKIFNTRLDSKSVRAIDYLENDSIDEAAVEGLVHGAAKINIQKTK